MQVILKVGCENLALPNCKSIDSLLAMLKDAKVVNSESTNTGRDANGDYVHDSALVASRDAGVEVRVVTDDAICTPEQWRERVKAVEAKIDPEQTRKAQERYRAAA